MTEPSELASMPAGSEQFGARMLARYRPRTGVRHRTATSGRLIGAVGRASVGFGRAVGRSSQSRPVVQPDNLTSPSLRPPDGWWTRAGRDELGDEPAAWASAPSWAEQLASTPQVAKRRTIESRRPTPPAATPMQRQPAEPPRPKDRLEALKQLMAARGERPLTVAEVRGDTPITATPPRERVRRPAQRRVDPEQLAAEVAAERATTPAGPATSPGAIARRAVPETVAPATEAIAGMVPHTPARGSILAPAERGYSADVAQGVVVADDDDDPGGEPVRRTARVPQPRPWPGHDRSPSSPAARSAEAAVPSVVARPGAPDRSPRPAPERPTNRADAPDDTATRPGDLRQQRLINRERPHRPGRARAARIETASAVGELAASAAVAPDRQVAASVVRRSLADLPALPRVAGATDESPDEPTGDRPVRRVTLPRAMSRGHRPPTVLRRMTATEPAVPKEPGAAAPPLSLLGRTEPTDVSPLAARTTEPTDASRLAAASPEARTGRMSTPGARPEGDRPAPSDTLAPNTHRSRTEPDRPAPSDAVAPGTPDRRADRDQPAPSGTASPNALAADGRTLAGADRAAAPLTGPEGAPPGDITDPHPTLRAARVSRFPADADPSVDALGTALGSLADRAGPLPAAGASIDAAPTAASPDIIAPSIAGLAGRFAATSPDDAGTALPVRADASTTSAGLTPHRDSSANPTARADASTTSTGYRDANANPTAGADASTTSTGYRDASANPTAGAEAGTTSSGLIGLRDSSAAEERRGPSNATPAPDAALRRPDITAADLAALLATGVAGADTAAAAPAPAQPGTRRAERASRYPAPGAADPSFARPPQGVRRWPARATFAERARAPLGSVAPAQGRLLMRALWPGLERTDTVAPGRSPDAPLAMAPGPAITEVVRRSPADEGDPTDHERALVAPAALDRSVAGEQLAARFLDELARSTRESAAPLPVAYRPMAEAITGRKPVLLSTDRASRRALRRVGKLAATTGDTIHLDVTASELAAPAPRISEIIAHELTHVANPSPAPRFFDDVDESPEERRAEAVARVISRSPLAPMAATVAAPTLTRRPTGARPTEVVRRMPTSSHSGSSSDSVSASDLAASIAGRSASANVVRRQHVAAPPAPAAPTSSATPAAPNTEPAPPGQPGGSPADRDEEFRAMLERNLDVIIRRVEDHILIDIERRGGRAWRGF